MNTAEQFFFDNAGYGYRPDRESEFVGRVLYAMELARAEAWAREAGAVFEWSEDDIDSSEWSEERPSWAQYACVMLLPCDECAPFVYGHEATAIKQCPRKLYTHVAGSLGGIDFGRDGSPGYDQSYTRVVEAELALEAMPE
jgi:hypothetical protein